VPETVIESGESNGTSTHYKLLGPGREDFWVDERSSKEDLNAVKRLHEREGGIFLVEGTG
jgi:hypothetical protein